MKKKKNLYTSFARSVAFFAFFFRDRGEKIVKNHWIKKETNTQSIVVAFVLPLVDCVRIRYSNIIYLLG